MRAPPPSLLLFIYSSLVKSFQFFPWNHFFRQVNLYAKNVNLNKSIYEINLCAKNIITITICILISDVLEKVRNRTKTIILDFLYNFGGPSFRQLIYSSCHPSTRLLQSYTVTSPYMPISMLLVEPHDFFFSDDVSNSTLFSCLFISISFSQERLQKSSAL